MTEEELRSLGGVPAEPEVTFLGERFAIREDGLYPLIRFARAATTDSPDQPVPLGAVYELLGSCITEFGRFGLLATERRAQLEDIRGLVPALVSWYCGRSHWPAMRLIGFVAGNLEELDGQLIRAGHPGVKALSAREACDVALAACLEGRSEDDREAFLTDLNYEGDAASEALAQLREFQARQKAAGEPGVNGTGGA